MKNNFQSKAVPRGTRTIWRYLSALIILFTFAIGNVWAATSTNPATKSYGGKTFLDVAATAANARIKNSDSTLVYNSTYLLKTLNPAWITGTTATDKSDSKSNFSNLPDYGFLAEGSSSAVNSTNEGGYSYIKITNAKEFVIYVTGTNSIAFLGKGNKDNSNKWIGVKVEEIDSEGNATVVADASSNKNYSSSNAITEATTNTASQALVISPNKYYRATVTSGNSSNCQVWQFRFGKAPAANYTVTYALNGGTGTTPTESAKAAGAKFNLHDGTTGITAPSGKEFDKWKDQDANLYAAGAEFTMPAKNVTLTAQWRDPLPKYTVTYSLNGASGDAPTETDKAAGDAFNLAAAPSWAGHAFDGWLCSADAAVKAAGSSYTMTAANTTFTAQWHELECKIYSFTGGIGSATAQTANATVDAEKMFVKDSGDKIRLTPASGETFKVGDIITFSGNLNNLSKKFGLKLYANGGSSVSQTIENAAGTVPMICSAALTFNADYIDFARADGTGTTVYTCEVHRACAEGIAAGLSYAVAAVDKTEGDAAFTNALTNANGLVVAGYSSSNTAVATVASNGQVTIVAPGSATITANSAVQTKAGVLYAAGTASYTLTVAACTPPRTPEFATTDPVVVTKNSATATWDVLGGHESVAKYQVSVVKISDASVVLDWTDCVYATPCTYEATGLEPETAYTFKLRSVGADGYCALSDVVTEDFTTLADLADKYTVIFKDGTTELATQQFEVGTYPSDAGVSKTKPLFTFAAWQKDEADIALDAAFWTTVAKDAEVTLTARWAKAYATSYDMEAYAASDGASKEGLEAALTAANYAYTNINGIDNGHTHNYTYDGMKYKTNDGDLSFNVVADKVVEVKTGHLPSNDAVTMYINGVANATVFEGADESQETHKTNYFYSAVEALYRLEVLASKGTCAVKKVTIRDPYQVSYDPHGADAIAPQYGTPSVTLPTPANGTGVFKGWYDAATEGTKIGNAGASYTPTADITLHAQWETVSSDNTLSDLQVDGATVAGFDPDVHIYNLGAYEYGQHPEITSATATAAAAGATVAISNTPVHYVDATNDFWYVQANVTPASGTPIGYNQVRYTNKLKKGVSIIKATVSGGDQSTGFEATGYYGGTGYAKLASNKKMNTNNYVGVKLAAGKTFSTGDVLFVTTVSPSTSGGSQIEIYAESAGTNLIWNTEQIDLTDGIALPAAFDGLDEFYIVRKASEGAQAWNGLVDYVEVQHYMDPFIEKFEIEGIGALDITGTAITASVSSTFDVTALEPDVTAWANGGATVTPTGAQDFTIPVDYTVTSMYGEQAVYTVTITQVTPSVAPSITTQPQDANYIEGASIAALTVVAESAAGELSYQWQVKNGLNYEDIDGATATSYTPAISAIGSYTYRVVVTNTEESKPATSVESDDATIVIAADPSCATFVAASIPTADPYQYTNTGEWTIYNASSSGKRNGGDQVFGDVKDFEGNTVKGFAKERCVLIFEKDMKQIRFYSANAQRTWGDTPVRVSDDVETFLGTGTPSYSEYAATTSLIQADPSNNKEQIFIANGEFLAGKCYWFAFSGSLQIFQICAVEADPKADAPVFSGTLSDEAICPGNTFATLDATAAPVTSYAWYKDDEVIAGATAATYTPTVAGTYYCIATNSAVGHRDNSTKSAEAVLTINEAASVSMADASGKATASIALNAVATGANPHYAWYTCDDAEGNNAVAIAGAADAASYAIPTPVATQYYKVVVTTDCGSVSAVALVTLLPDIVPLADVTESTVWDWSVVTKVADGSDLSGNGPTVTTGNGLVIANYLQGDNFDKIEGNNGAYSIRSSSNKFYQGASLHMHTTKGGILTIRARSEGHEMTLNVENEGRDIELGNLGNWKNYTIYVKAGDVTIYNVPAESTYPMRVEKITFTVKDAPDYSRDVTNNIGTLCVDHNVVVGGALGATFYQIASRNELYDYKIDFEEVLPNEELKAGEPYIFQSTTGRIDLFFGETVAAEPVAVRGMIGNYAAGHLDITEDNKADILYIAQNKLWTCEDLVGTGLTLNANRCYIKMSDVPAYNASPSQGAPRRRVTLGRDAEQVATGCENLNVSDKPVKMILNGQLFILRGEKMFDATGRLVK